VEIDTRHWRALRAVMEHGSFNRAAEALGVTQPAISKSIALIERVAKIQVLQRGHRGAVPTEAGIILGRTAVAMTNLAQQAREELSSLGEEALGPLIVGATPSAMTGLMPAVFRRLCEDGTPLRITLREGLDSELQPALERGEISLLVGPVTDNGVPSPAIIEGVLLTECMYVGMAPGNPLAQSRALHIKDLLDHPWVLPSAGSRFHHLIEAVFLSRGLAWPADSIRTNSLHLQKQIVLASRRLFLLTDVELVGQEPGFAVVPLAGSPVRKFGWKRLKAVVPSPMAKRFVDVMTDLTTGRG
jgi:DNA-binding transcriptional LysR family regulator